MTSTAKPARLVTQKTFIFKFQGSVFANTLPDESLKPSRTIRCTGGANETRTRDPLLAKQVLSQLSYSPILREAGSQRDGWWA